MTVTNQDVTEWSVSSTDSFENWYMEKYGAPLPDNWQEQLLVSTSQKQPQDLFFAISFGLTGDADVQRLQNQLNLAAQKFNRPDFRIASGATGNYGSQTQVAVGNFQSAMGLDVDINNWRPIDQDALSALLNESPDSVKFYTTLKSTASSGQKVQSSMPFTNPITVTSSPVTSSLLSNPKVLIIGLLVITGIFFFNDKKYKED